MNNTNWLKIISKSLKSKIKQGTNKATTETLSYIANPVIHYNSLFYKLSH